MVIICIVGIIMIDTRQIVNELKNTIGQIAFEDKNFQEFCGHLLNFKNIYSQNCTINWFDYLAT